MKKRAVREPKGNETSAVRYRYQATAMEMWLWTLVCLTVSCKVQSRAVSKSPINLVINPKPVHCHSITWQYFNNTTPLIGHSIRWSFLPSSTIYTVGNRHSAENWFPIENRTVKTNETIQPAPVFHFLGGRSEKASSLITFPGVTFFLFFFNIKGRR
jgi:hypothetical protein